MSQGNTAFTGIEGLYLAIMQDGTDTNDIPAAYDEVDFISEVTQVGVSPQSQFGVLYANNKPVETDTADGEIQVQVQTKQLPLWVQAKIFGHQFNAANGMLLAKNGDSRPYVAIGFCFTKSNGKKRFVWLYKGKAALPQEQGQTKSNTPQFNTPTINFTFVSRNYDDAWKFVADEEEGYVNGSTFFSQVQEYTPDTTAPTVTTTPVDGATGVAVDASIVATFSEKIRPADVSSANFILVNNTDSSLINGSLSLDATGMIVTFDPVSNLSAATQYTFIITSGVRDLAGNRLQTTVVNFTTA